MVCFKGGAIIRDGDIEVTSGILRNTLRVPKDGRRKSEGNLGVPKVCLRCPEVILGEARRILRIGSKTYAYQQSGPQPHQSHLELLRSGRTYLCVFVNVPAVWTSAALV